MNKVVDRVSKILVITWSILNKAWYTLMISIIRKLFLWHLIVTRYFRIIYIYIIGNPIWMIKSLFVFGNWNVSLHGRWQYKDVTRMSWHSRSSSTIRIFQVSQFYITVDMGIHRRPVDSSHKGPKCGIGFVVNKITQRDTCFLWQPPVKILCIDTIF